MSDYHNYTVLNYNGITINHLTVNRYINITYQHSRIFQCNILDSVKVCIYYSQLLVIRYIYN